MAGSGYESDTGGSTDGRKDQAGAAAPRTPLLAAGESDDDAQRREETIEEPGYGHGV